MGAPGGRRPRGGYGAPGGTRRRSMAGVVLPRAAGVRRISRGAAARYGDARAAPASGPALTGNTNLPSGAGAHPWAGVLLEHRDERDAVRAAAREGKLRDSRAAHVRETVRRVARARTRTRTSSQSPTLCVVRARRLRRNTKKCHENTTHVAALVYVGIILYASSSSSSAHSRGMVVPTRSASALRGSSRIPAGRSRITRGKPFEDLSSFSQRALRSRLPRPPPRTPGARDRPRPTRTCARRRARAASRSCAREKRFCRLKESETSSPSSPLARSFRAAKITFTGVSTVHDVTGPISRASATANDSAAWRAFEPRTPLKQFATTTPIGRDARRAVSQKRRRTHQWRGPAGLAVERIEENRISPRGRCRGAVDPQRSP